MNAPISLPKVESWQAWQLDSYCSHPIPLINPPFHSDALMQAMGHVRQKDTLAILYTHTGLNKRVLWLYTIKRSTKRYGFRPAHDGGPPVRVGELEPHLICETAVAAFEPVRPFDAFRDDPVGRDLTLVDGRAAA